MLDIKGFRLEKRISQRDLAHVLGVSQGYVSLWELRRRPFPEEGVQKLISTFGEDDVMKFDTLTEEDMQPDYVKQESKLFRKSATRKVIYEDDFRKETVEKLLAETAELKAKNEEMLAALYELRKDMEMYRDLLRNKYRGVGNVGMA